MLGFLLPFLILTSCSLPSKRKLPRTTLPSYQKNYNLTDKAGSFSVSRQGGKLKGREDYGVRREVFAGEGMDGKRVVEKSMALATPTTFRGINILRPKVSEYLVWFDNKKHFSRLQWDEAGKNLVLQTSSPQGRKSKKVALSREEDLFCFFSMLFECATITGFVHQAIKARVGEMKFVLLWDGHPYFQDQYENLPKEIFSRATLSFEDITAKGQPRFSLNVGGQTIFYVLGAKGLVEKAFWIAQGMSMVRVLD